MLLKNTLLLLHLFFVGSMFGQEKWFRGSFISNSQYYLDDKETGDFDEEDRFRSNNYLDLTAGANNFSFGLQLEGYVPRALLNYSPSYDKEIGLATYFVNFKNERLDLTAGYFYGQFGSGLIFRSWEDVTLGLNNAILGGKITYLPYEFLSITGLYGKQRDGFDQSDGVIFGLDTEFDLTQVLTSENMHLRFGLSAINRNQKIENAAEGFDENTLSLSGRMTYSGEKILATLEYVLKNEDALVESGFVDTGSLAKGNALLINASYFVQGLGLNATFRRLENMSFYSDREAEGNPYNEKIINYLPGLTKQYDYQLANIYVYQTQSRLTYTPFEKAGEIGMQMDVFYDLKKNTFFGGKYGTQLAFNYSAWYGLDAEFDSQNRTYEAEFIGFGEKYYTDMNLELRKTWTEKWSSIFVVIDLFYNQAYLEERSGEVNAQIAVAETTYRFSSKKSLRAEAQHLWTDDDRKNWIAGMFEMNFSNKVSLFVSDTYNYGNEIKKIHYYNFGGSYTKNSTRITLNYGRQRGGLLCVGGVCRFVPESTGFGLSLHTSF
jgi:hypothetical protein